jgi:hypothetical protein
MSKFIETSNTIDFYFSTIDVCSSVTDFCFGIIDLDSSIIGFDFSTIDFNSKYNRLPFYPHCNLCHEYLRV